MRLPRAQLLPLLLLLTPWLPPSTAQAPPTRSPKRGLVSVSNSHSNTDSPTWTQRSSDLTWYYNYSPTPNSAFPSLEFIPMLFNIPDSSSTFNTQITTLLSSNAKSKTPTSILSFNEPDGPTSQGGTSLPPSSAAKSYLHDLAPLLTTHRDQTIHLGWPAVTGSPRGLTWLADFNTSCHALSPTTGGCPASFLPVHWYGDFPGLASYLSQVHSLYPSLPLWVTEFADPNADLAASQGFFNESVAFLDAAGYVARYAYFGAFRSQDSNVGGEGTMLDRGGGLTEVGEWYLGLNGTGMDPGSGVGRRRVQWWVGGLVGMAMAWELGWV